MTQLGHSERKTKCEKLIQLLYTHLSISYEETKLLRKKCFELPNVKTTYEVLAILDDPVKVEKLVNYVLKKLYAPSFFSFFNKPGLTQDQKILLENWKKSVDALLPNPALRRKAFFYALSLPVRKAFLELLILSV